MLADFLTRQGIAVLPLDDRGVGGSTSNLMTSSYEDFAEDILTAVAWLKQRNDIDAKHIGLIGHSEGGLIAPQVAVRAGDCLYRANGWTGSWLRSQAKCHFRVTFGIELPYSPTLFLTAPICGQPLSSAGIPPSWHETLLTSSTISLLLLTVLC